MAKLHNKNMNTLGKRLKECRAEKGVSQAEAAKAVGMSQASISDLENDLYPTSTYTLRLSAYYGVNPHWLETGKGLKEIPPMSPVTAEIMRIYDGLDDKMKKVLLEQARILKKLNE